MTPSMVRFIGTEQRGQGRTSRWLVLSGLTLPDGPLRGGHAFGVSKGLTAVSVHRARAVTWGNGVGENTAAG